MRRRLSVQLWVTGSAARHETTAITQRCDLLRPRVDRIPRTSLQDGEALVLHTWRRDERAPLQVALGRLREPRRLVRHSALLHLLDRRRFARVLICRNY